MTFTRKYGYTKTYFNISIISFEIGNIFYNISTIPTILDSQHTILVSSFYQFYHAYLLSIMCYVFSALVTKKNYILREQNEWMNKTSSSYGQS